jgi:hypothetical protein
MQIYEFTGPSSQPSRTSNQKALITFHEMGHYITHRLVGNASGFIYQQGGAMGVGWGDFFAICMTSEHTDDLVNGDFAVDGWTDLRPCRTITMIRSGGFPYTADMMKNPPTLTPQVFITPMW